MEGAHMTIFPVLSMRESVVLPGSTLPLRIGRSQSIAAVEAAMKSGNLILAISQKSNLEHEEVTIDDLHTTGTLSQVERIRGNAKDGFQIYLRGISRYRVNQLTNKEGYIAASAEEWKDVMDAEPSTYKTMMEVLKEMSLKIINLLP